MIEQRTRRHAIAEHLDKLHNQSLRICSANGPCACVGCAGEVNNVRVRQHELDLYFAGQLFPGQIRREDKIKHEILSQLKDDGFCTPDIYP